MGLIDEAAALLRQMRKAKDEKELPALVVKLEAELERLRSALAEFEPRGERCPSCGLLSWFVTASTRARAAGCAGRWRRYRVFAVSA